MTVLKLSLDDAVHRGLREQSRAQAGGVQRKSHPRREKCRPCRNSCPPLRSSATPAFISTTWPRRALARDSSTVSAAVPWRSSAGFSLITQDTLTEGQIPAEADPFLRPGDRRLARRRERPRAPPILPRCRPAAKWCSRWPRPICMPLPRPARWTTPRRSNRQDQVLLDQAHAAHEAGTASNLDELRARVQLQAQQQVAHRRPEQSRQGPDPAQARNRPRSRPEDRADRSRSLQRSGRADAGRSPRRCLQESPGLPEPAEPGGRVQGHLTTPIAASDCPRSASTATMASVRSAAWARMEHLSRRAP